MYTGQHVVNIYFHPLGLEIDRKEGGGGGFLGIKILNLNLLHFHNISNLIPQIFQVGHH